MEAVNNLLIVNIMFMILQYASYMNAECYTRQYKILPGGCNVFLQKGVQPAFNTVRLNDHSECGVLCAHEGCKMWRFGDGKCQIFHSLKDRITVIKSSNTTMKTYYETDEDGKWLKMYFVKSESGFKVGPSFLGIGDYKSWGPATCTQKLCPDFFRSSLIDAWNALPINEVKLSLFKNNTEILYLIFDGQGTNSQNWFAMSRVLKSPWKDVHKGATSNFFDIDHHSLRSFYASQSHAGCPNDFGWIIVIEPKVACTWDTQPAYPYIIYSDKDYAIQWGKGYAVADALAVYISF